MRIQPSLLWTWNCTIDRAPYLLAGVMLFLVKFAIDWTVAKAGFGLTWSPLNYLVWPNDRVLRVFELDDPERRFSLTMLLVSVPFIWAGVILTLHRLRAAGLPPGLIVLFFVPLVNLLLFLILVVLPTRAATGAEGVLEGDAGAGELPAHGRFWPPTSFKKEAPMTVWPRWQVQLRQIHRSIVLESYWRSGLVALAMTVPLAVLGVFVGAQLLQSYGFSLFVGAPFALGMISVLLFGFSRPKPFGACMLVAMAALLLAGAAVLAVALEGLICLIMSSPIIAVLGFFGALVGYVIQTRPWLSDQALTCSLLMVLVLPSLMATESAQEPEPKVRAIDTEVIIDAPPAKVWPLVLSFPPLPEPDDWLFQTGIAYPKRARIDGAGVGAVRYCIFSTGTFVEPIDAWEPPSRLRFRVTEQPEPMLEWSPHAIHPPHLDHCLRSHKGQFLLEPLPDGRTRLVGTTWYSNRMWPESYWNLWSDYIIHRIHARVLTHIKKLAESP
jgi:Polyketide cyclase / dehydrase and lipid transport